MRLPRSLPLRTKFLLTALAGGVVPLGLLGAWLTHTAVRSGEDLLRAQLTESLEHVARELDGRWVHRRSDLLLLAENGAVLQALRGAGPAATEADTLVLSYLREAYTGVAHDIEFIRYSDARGTPRWVLAADAPVLRVEAAGSSHHPPVVGVGSFVPVHLEIEDPETGGRVGGMEAHVRLSGLLPPGSERLGPPDAVLSLLERRTGLALLPTDFDQRFLSRERFAWRDQTWLVVRHPLQDPPIDLAMAAPLDSYTRPFEETARRGVLALIIVASIGLGIAVAMSRYFTRSFERLVEAAEAVSRGDLDRKIDVGAPDEVGRVALAFNTMTESLRRTLRELSHRQALAAVGEFAAILAHEVRNPLTSIRIDLQRVREKLAEDSKLRDPLTRALGAVERLDGTVSGSLRVARSGRIHPEPLDLRSTLQSAVHTAEPEFAARGAVVEPLPSEPAEIRIVGDASALGQLFLNLLLNAAQALGPAGRAGIALEMEAGSVTVSIWDTGSGIPAEELARIFEPFYTTRAGGTGLGLAVAQRIATAHGGDIQIESTPGTGTTVRVRLPLGGTNFAASMA